MNKLLVGLQVIVLLFLGYIVYDAKIVNQPGTVPSDFNVTADSMVVDVVGQSVTLPGGVVWGFNPDQQIKVTLVSKKGTDGAVLVYNDMSATVKFQQPPPTKEQSKASKEKQPLAKSATMTGLAKFYYEKVQGNWYLIHVESVNLKLSAVE